MTKEGIDNSQTAKNLQRLGLGTAVTLKHKENADFILDPEKQPQRIDHAVGSLKIKNTEVRYHGAYLYKKEKREKKGKVYSTETMYPVLILEDTRIITLNPKNLHDYNIELKSILSKRLQRWSLESINNFIYGAFDKENYTFASIFKDIKKLYSEAMVFEDKRWYCLNPLFDMCSYFIDLFDSILIIKHEGISGSAKSKAMKISSNIMLNGKKFLCPTPATFFRYRHHNKSGLCIEEAERLFDTSKKQQTQQSELVEYLNGSYERGNTVPRQNDKDLAETLEFDPFGLTRLGSIKPLRGALKARSITINMIIAVKKDARSEYEVPSAEDPAFQKMRDRLYICSLTNYERFAIALFDLKNKYDLANREWIVSKPLLAMAHCISPELKKEMANFLEDLFQRRDDNLDDTSWSVKLGYILIEESANPEEEGFISTTTTLNKFRDAINIHDFSTQAFATQMSFMGFDDYKKRNKSKTKRGYRMNFWKVVEVLIRNGIFHYEDIIKTLSTLSSTSLTPISVPNFKVWYRDTFGDIGGDTPLETIEKGDRGTGRTRVYEGGGVEFIYHKCHHCGLPKCIDFDSRGRPICHLCRDHEMDKGK